MKNNGSLIAADSITLQTNNLENFGTITSNQRTQIVAANNISNTGTISSGGNTVLVAGNDITNHAGTISAGGDVALKAGHDITLDAKTTEGFRTAVGFTNYTTNTVNGVSTIAAGGNVTILAGNNANLIAAQVTAGKDLAIAGANVTLSAVKNSTYSETGSGKNSSQQYNETVIGTNLTAGGALSIGATKDITITASNATAGGALNVAAGGNLLVQGQTATNDSLSQTSKTSTGFLSSTTTSTKARNTTTTTVGSVLSGNTVNLGSAKDTTIIGSSVVGVGDVQIAAQGNLTITSAQNTAKFSSSSTTTSSGLSFAPSGIGINYGDSKVSQSLQGATLSQVGSTIGSLGGNVTLNSNGATTITASNITAASDLNIGGASVTVNAANNTSTSTQTISQSWSGFSLGLNNSALTAGTTALGDLQHAGQVQNKNLALLLDLQAAQQLKQLPGDLKNGATIAKGSSVTASFGSSSATSTSTSNSTTAVTSTLSGTNVTIDARSGDLTLVGAAVNASGNVALTAAQNIVLAAAKDNTNSTSTSQSSGFSLGAQFGLTGGPPSLSASANSSNGSTNASSVNWIGTVINAGGSVGLTSGGNTSIIGSQVNGNSITAKIGGNFDIVSLQNSNNYDSHSSSQSGSIGLTGNLVTGSLNLSDNKLNANWNSVVNQAGLFAGAGGFNVNVAGNTNLIGAVITSSADPSKNVFSTGTITTSDLTNTSSYSGQNASVGLGYSSKPGTGYNGVTAQPPSAVGANGKASSTTSSGISAGSFSITNAAGQQALTGQTVAQALAGINTVTTTGPNTLAQNNLTAIQEDMQIAGIVGSEVNQFIEYQQARIQALKGAAAQEGDTPQGRADLAKATELQSQWGFGGTDRKIVNALVGAFTGNATGSLGQIAQSSFGNFVGAQLSTEIGKLANSGKIPDGSPLNVLLHTISACAGATIGGDSCGASALGAGSAAIASNLFNDPKSTAEQKQNQENLIASIAAGVGVASGSGNVAAIVTSAQTTVEDNLLNVQQYLKIAKTLTSCDSPACVARTLAAANILSQKQDLLFGEGIASGFNDAAKGTGTALLGAIKDPNAFLNGIATILSDPAVIANKEFENQLNDLKFVMGQILTSPNPDYTAMGKIFGGELFTLATAAIEGAAGKVAVKLGTTSADALKTLTTATRLTADTSNLESKIFSYLLDSSRIKDNKSGIFRDILGFNENNWRELASQLVFDPSKAIPTLADQYGQRFNQTILITGANGRQMSITAAFIVDPGSAVARFVTAVPLKK